jgi:pimeloyl-ACP methyl ester carboxylesterase
VAVLLTHDILGDGAPVVLLHSSVGDRRMWEPQWGPLLDAGYRVLRPDLRGFGDSPPPTGLYDNARDVMDLLDTHGLDRVSLVGASFGGRMAQEIAARWPARVGTLVLLCAAMEDHPPTLDIQVFSDREDDLLAEGDIDGAVALNVRTFVGPEADEATRDLVATMQRRAFEVQLQIPDNVQPSFVDYKLEAITARTLVVSGGHDLRYFTQIADVLGERIDDAERLHLDWAGHLPSLECPERLNPVLLDFLAR